MTDPTADAAKLLPFTEYQRKQIAELRPYVPGETLDGVSVSEADRLAGSPKAGDMIARNPKYHEDRWLVAAKYFADNFESVNTRPQPAPHAVTELRTALKNMADAYERRVRTVCDAADLAKEPWRCAEYVEAERLCKGPFKLLFDDEWVRRGTERDGDTEQEAGVLHPEAPPPAPPAGEPDFHICQELARKILLCYGQRPVQSPHETDVQLVGNMIAEWCAKERLGLSARLKVEDAEVAEAVAMLRRLGDGIGGEMRDLANPQLSKAADLLERLSGNLRTLQEQLMQADAAHAANDPNIETALAMKWRDEARARHQANKSRQKAVKEKP